MPVFDANLLRQFTQEIFCAIGASSEEADIVAKELVSANLVGHDSHGVIRIMQYVETVRNGKIKPGAAVQVVRETRAMAVLDAQFGFGQVAASRALDAAMSKARDSAVSAVWVRNCNHIGRLGSYTERAAAAGFSALMAISSPGGRSVAPFGGIDRRMGTNPISIAVPARPGPLVLDMTTSAVAEGKLRVAFQKGEQVPPGWIIDSEGRPSTDPKQFYGEPRGAILPLGGDLGYKGFGLSLMLDALCGALSGFGAIRPDLVAGTNAVWLTLYHVEQLFPVADFHTEIDHLSTHVKSSRKVPGTAEILLPGEIETRRAAQRRTAGIPIPDETWRQICETARLLGVSPPAPQGGAS